VFHNKITKYKLLPKQTCTYAQLFLQGRVNPQDTRVRRWKHVTLCKTEGFIACLVNINTIRTPTFASYWCTSKSQYVAWFHDMF
jgi:hypothetical protein